MKRLVKKLSMVVPQIGESTKISNDPQYVDCKSVWFAGGYRDGVIIIINDKLYYGKGEHTDLVRKIIRNGEADWEDKVYYGNYVNSFLGNKSIFLDEYNLDCADIIAENDSNVIVYQVVFGSLNVENESERHDGYFIRLK